MDQYTYDTLTTLPLLRGICAADLVQLLDNTQVRITSIEAGEWWVEQGELCRRLSSLLRGTMEAKTTAADESYSVTEIVTAPMTIELDTTYGISTRYAATYTAIEPCHLLTIEKEAIGRLFSTCDVFRINYLNQLSALAAHRQQRGWLSPALTLDERIMQLFSLLYRYPNGEKRLQIRMKDIGKRLGASRRLVSEALYRLQDKGLLTFRREHIIIHETPNV